MPLEDKLAVLAGAEAGLRTQPGVATTYASFQAFAVEQTFASTEGALCEQRTTECGGGLAVVAVDEHEVQIRSYPASHGGSIAQAGYEHFLALDLPGRAPAVAEEAVALLRAPACPPVRTTLILAGEQLGLQLHESVGHAVELDRVLGREASYAGTSFVPADGIGSLRFGSEHVDVTADATTPGALGSFRWDDEGVEAQAVPIVRAGVLAGFLSSRETAAEIGLSRSGGCMRADGFARQPIVRMTNVNLEPGDGRQPRRPDRRHRRRHPDRDQPLVVDRQPPPALPVRGRGGLGDRATANARRLLRNPSYAGLTPDFWASCDAVCSPAEWRLVSLLECGKGEPGQLARVSHGSAPARFRDVQVGVA